ILFLLPRPLFVDGTSVFVAAFLVLLPEQGLLLPEFYFCCQDLFLLTELPFSLLLFSFCCQNRDFRCLNFIFVAKTFFVAGTSVFVAAFLVLLPEQGLSLTEFYFCCLDFFCSRKQ
ncbi:hypothetical protein, partial [Bacillus sp. V59.32b]|uniref:hypothetical protein n=1 Tax=Bacillus sp. V59.32b TaxID=1758642 RepID=UPI000ED4F48D